MKNWINTIMGVAYGDGWGYPNEFKKYAELTKIDRRGPSMPKHLRVSDDTQMTLALASAIDMVYPLPHDVIRESIVEMFLSWYRDPDNTRAPGTTCMTALGRIADGQPWHEATSLSSDGCGANMRVSPAAWLPGDLWAPVAAFQAAVTHGSPTGIAAALLTAAVIRAAAQDKLAAGSVTQMALVMATDPKSIAGMCAGVGPWLKGLPTLVSDSDKAVKFFLAIGFERCANALREALKGVEALAEDPWAFDPCLVAGEGWRAHEALAVALLSVDVLAGWPVLSLRRAATTGGDSDSIAAIAGAVIGSLYPSPWPGEWFSRLEDRYADEIADAVGLEFAW